jgi:hypothetical protein
MAVCAAHHLTPPCAWPRADRHHGQVVSKARRAEPGRPGGCTHGALGGEIVPRVSAAPWGHGAGLALTAVGVASAGRSGAGRCRRHGAAAVRRLSAPAAAPALRCCAHTEASGRWPCCHALLKRHGSERHACGRGRACPHAPGSAPLLVGPAPAGLHAVAVLRSRSLLPRVHLTAPSPPLPHPPSPHTHTHSPTHHNLRHLLRVWVRAASRRAAS